MARELEIVVTVQDAQAKQQLAEVDTAIDRLEDKSSTAAGAIDKVGASARTASGNVREAAGQTRELASQAGDVAAKGGLAASTIAKFGGPAGVATAAAVALGAAAHSAMSFADRVKTLSERTGASYGFIQRAGRAAEVSGSSFERIASAMQTLDNNLINGTPRARRAIDDLGLSLDGILRMNPEDRIMAVAVAMSRVDDPARRSADAIGLFGDQGKELIPVLDRMAKGDWLPIIPDTVIQGLADSQQGLTELKQAGEIALSFFIGWPAALSAWARDVGLVFTKGLSDFGAITGLDTLYAKAASVLNYLLSWPATLGQWASDVATSIRAGAGNAATAIAEMAYGNAGPAVGGPTMPNWLAGQQAPNGAPGYAIVNGSGLPGGVSTGGGGGTGARVIPFPATAPIAATPNLSIATYPTLAPLVATPQLFQGVGYAGPLPSTPQQFQGVGYAPTVAMEAPTQGSWTSNAWSQLTSGPADQGGWDRVGQAGAAIGGQLLGNWLGRGGQNRSQRTGSQIGSTIGSIGGAFFGPIGSMALGALGGWIGGGLGNLFGAGEEGEVNDARDAFFAQFGDSRADQVANLNSRVHEVGLSLDRIYNAETMQQFEDAVKEITDAFADQEEDTQRLGDAMQRYGFTIKDTGREFRQSQIDKTAGEFLTDFRVLIGAGIDLNEVLGRMAPAVSDFVIETEKMGGKVPLEMKPMIEKMIEMGKLTDENGDKITDLKNIDFAPDLVGSLEEVVKKLDVLLGRLARADSEGGEAFRRLQQGADNYADAINRIPDIPTMPDDNPETTMVARGGVIAGPGNVLYFRGGGFVPHGTDTVPAMLTPGEMVLSREIVRDLARAGRQGHGGLSLSVGSLVVEGGRTRADVVDAIGSEIVAYLERHGARVAA